MLQQFKDLSEALVTPSLLHVRTKTFSVKFRTHLIHISLNYNLFLPSPSPVPPPLLCISP